MGGLGLVGRSITVEVSGRNVVPVGGGSWAASRASMSLRSTHQHVPRTWPVGEWIPRARASRARIHREIIALPAGWGR